MHGKLSMSNGIKRQQTVASPIESVVSAAFIEKWGSHLKIEGLVITVKYTEDFKRRWSQAFSHDLQKIPRDYIVRYEAH